MSTCVGYGYGQRIVKLEAFLGSMKSETSLLCASTFHSPSQSTLKVCGFAYIQDSLLRQAQSVACFSYPSPSLQSPIRRYRNINLLSIDYAFRPRLRSRLTLGGRAFPRKPCSIGVQDSHLQSILTPAFSLPSSPPVLTIRLHP